MLFLEHKSQEVLSTKHFIKRLFLYLIFALLLVFCSVLIGVLGYHYIAGLSWLDSFHMACMILTGMGPVKEMMTNKAKIFSSLYALYSGVAFLSITAVLFAPVVHRIMHILHLESD